MVRDDYEAHQMGFPQGNAPTHSMAGRRGMQLLVWLWRTQDRAQPYPQWMAPIMTQVMPHIGINSEVEWPNSCNANWYGSGTESVDWHADDETMFQSTHQATRIISLSLGTGRAFQVRQWWSGAPVTSQVLMDGDLCLMDGYFQRYYKHRVDKQRDVEGGRINLTWRWVRQHQAGCGAAEAKVPSPTASDE